MSLFPNVPDSFNWTLTDNEVHVWLASPDCCADSDLVSTYISWLDQQERERYSQFKFSQDRDIYLVAHALLRNCLSNYCSIDPVEIRFTRNEYGKPELSALTAIPPLRFSLSHTNGIVTCAVTLAMAVGIDAEHFQRKVGVWSVAQSSFASEEIAELQRCSIEARQRYFFQHWTLKEAYAKARGLGLYLPFNKLAFQLKPDSRDAISFTLLSHDEEDGPLNHWRFAVMSPAATHCIAFAVKSPEPLTAKVFRSVPGIKNNSFSPSGFLSQGITFS